MTVKQPILTLVNVPEGLMWITLDEQEQALTIVKEDMTIDFTAKTSFLGSPQENILPYQQIGITDWDNLCSHVRNYDLDRVVGAKKLVHFISTDEFNWLKIDFKNSFPINASADIKSKYSIDKSYLLESLLESSSFNSILAECQLSFLFFYIGQFEQGLNYWKVLTSVLCRCIESLERQAEFSEFIDILENQLMQCPPDLFIDPLSMDNFIAPSLSCFYANAQSFKDLQIRIGDFRNTILEFFGFDIDCESPDELPEIVELY